MKRARSYRGTRIAAKIGGNSWLTVHTTTPTGRTNTRSAGPSDLVTVRHAAAALGVFDMHVYRAIRAGELKAKRTRGRYRVRVSDLLKFRRQSA